MPTWRIDSGCPAQQTEMVDTAAVPLKWAHDARAGEPRYIHDVEVLPAAQMCA